MTVRLLVERHLAALSASERRVARLVTERYPVSALGGIEDIARQAAVSPPTVTRFVRRLGFGRFVDFQRAIRLEVQEGEASPLALLAKHRAAPPDPAARDRRLLDDLAASMGGLLGPSSAEALDRMADLLADPRSRVSALGGRWSSVAAQYLAFQLSTLRGDVQALVPPASGVLNDRIADMGRRDVLVVYDFRRYQPETIAFCRLARTRGVRVALVTDPELSPVCDVAAVVLPVPVATLSPLDTLVPALAATDALLARLVERIGPRATARIALIEELRRGVSQG